MSLRADYFKKVFHFNFKARTSRGLMKDKTSWFIRLKGSDPDIVGIGECGPLPGLSPDYEHFEERLSDAVMRINDAGMTTPEPMAIRSLISDESPAILFGFETAALDLHNGGERVVFRNDFLTGNPIPINGLIWMGDMDFMMDQINRKIAQGFRCLKLKVGGLDFGRECDILRYVRKKYFRESITIRLDANGAFRPDDALYKLGELARFDIHSIEQPIRPGLVEMEELCRKSPVPVAFDEELIGIRGLDRKDALLRRLKPAFIVLKPTLHGGFSGCEEWISAASKHGIGWWITSALESGIGLNAICQFTANYHPAVPQGLGTGAIYEDNFQSPLTVRDGNIYYDSEKRWEDLPL